MDHAPLTRIEALTAAEICTRFTLSREAQTLLRESMAPGAFVEALLANKQFVDGINFFAHALPHRDAVWWGCLCFQHACGNAMSARDRLAAAAAVRWVLHPGDATQCAAKAPAEAAGLVSPAGALAMAAYQTGPGFVSPGGPPVPVALPAAAQSVANAIKLCCTLSKPAMAMATQKSFVELGLGVAGGRFGVAQSVAGMNRKHQEV
jgi:uncharacterized protein DUF6931